MTKWLPVLLLLAAACAQRQTSKPMKDVNDAWAAAARITLPDRAPEEWDDLHNVYRLSDNIITGGEPLTEAALERVAGMGVKTILSVDGKIPDAAYAGKLGMRYVHVPIQYKTITRDELLRIAKTFRELDGPFYVHCFHGRHRGPAGAAVGRVVLDGVSREQALAEMRQWCGAAQKYEGLYQVIATGTMPTAAETKALAWDFPAAHKSSDLRTMMVKSTRHFDNLKLLAKNGWDRDSEHPDLDATNEAQILLGYFKQVSDVDAVKKAPEDFRRWWTDSESNTAKLVASLRSGAKTDANRSFAKIKKTCGACHASYRN